MATVHKCAHKGPGRQRRGAFARFHSSRSSRLTSDPLSGHLLRGNPRDLPTRRTLLPLFFGTVFLGATVSSCDPDDGSHGVAIPAVADLTATPDQVFTPEDTPVEIDVLTNDSSSTGVLVLLAVSEPDHGTTRLVEGKIRYVPEDDYFGRDGFAYSLGDGESSVAGAVEVTVTPVNDPPRVVDDAAETVTELAVTIDVLANDSDVENDVLEIADVGDPQNGTVTLNSDQWVTYLPAPNFSGFDLFSYTVSDGVDESTANVVVEVFGSTTLVFTYFGLGQQGEYLAAEGSVFLSVPVFVREDSSNSGFPNSIESFSMELRHDPLLLLATGVFAAPALWSLNGGAGPEFLSIQIRADEVIAEVVVSAGGLDALEAADPREVFAIEYASRPQILRGNPVGVATVLTWSQTAGNVLFSAGSPAVPSLLNVPILLTPRPPAPGFHFFAPGQGVPYAPRTGVAEVVESLFIEEGPETPGFPNALFGFSMGLEHDATVLAATDVRIGRTVQNLNGGAGPDYFDVDFVDRGLTLAVIFSSALNVPLLADGAQEVVEVHYETVPDRLVGNNAGLLTPLRFADDLVTSPRIRNRVVLSGGHRLGPTRVSGAILLRPVP